MQGYIQNGDSVSHISRVMAGVRFCDNLSSAGPIYKQKLAKDRQHPTQVADGVRRRICLSGGLPIQNLFEILVKFLDTFLEIILLGPFLTDDVVGSVGEEIGVGQLL